MPGDCHTSSSSFYSLHRNYASLCATFSKDFSYETAHHSNGKVKFTLCIFFNKSKFPLQKNE